MIDCGRFFAVFNCHYTCSLVGLVDCTTVDLSKKNLLLKYCIHQTVRYVSVQYTSMSHYRHEIAMRDQLLSLALVEFQTCLKLWTLYVLLYSTLLCGICNKGNG